MGERRVEIWKIVRASLVLIFLLLPLLYYARKADTRLIGYRLNQNTDCYGYDYDTDIYEITPNCEQRISIDDRVVKMTTDRFGFRPTGSIVGTKRVLVLGGSIQAGFGLADDQLRPINALAKISSEHFPDIEWINASVQGYTTTHLAIRFRRLLDTFKPNLVILDSLHGPHLLRDAALYERIEFDETGSPRRLPIPTESISPLFKKVLGLESRRALRNELLEYWDVVMTARRIDSFETKAEREGAWIRPTISLIDFMQRKAKEGGVNFIVLLEGRDSNQNISVNQEVTKTIASFGIFFLPRNQILPARELEKILSANGISNILLPPEFMETVQRQPGYLLVDRYHLSEKGAALFGQFAFQALEPQLKELSQVKGIH